MIRSIVPLLCLAPLWAAAAAAAPADRPPLQLYEARAIVTGTDLRSRPAGMAACLTDVLVKVSGDPALIGDPRVAALGALAAGLATDFDYLDRLSGRALHDEQGSYDRPYDLTVRFDHAKIDAALAGLGERPWTGERPTLLPVLVTVGARTTTQLLAGDARGADQSYAWQAAADRYAMTLHIASADDWRHGLAPSPGMLPVVGSLTWSDAAHGWVGAWQTTWHGRAAHWDVTGVSFDEAFRIAVRGTLAVVSGHTPG